MTFPLKVGDEPASVWPPPIGPTDALERLKLLDLNLHCDFKGSPRIVLPDDPPNTTWPTRSPRVEDWLAAWYFGETSHVLHKLERERILTVLSGLAQKATRAPSEDELWIALEHEPVALELLEFIASRRNEPYIGTMSDLHKKLVDRMEKQRIAHRKWPKKPNILSFQLKRLAPALLKAGLQIVIKHTNKGSEVTLTWRNSTVESDEGQAASSPSPSPPSSRRPSPLNSTMINDLPCDDAGGAGKSSIHHQLRELRNTHHDNCP